MITAFITQNSPALLIMVPLIGAFLCPFIGKISAAVRNIWAVGAMALTSAIAFLLAFDVYSAGTRVYVFGASAVNSAIPLDSGGIPIRIIFTVDAMSALMQIIAAIAGLAVILYSVSSERSHSGIETTTRSIS